MAAPRTDPQSHRTHTAPSRLTSGLTSDHKPGLISHLKHGWQRYLHYRAWLRRHLIAITVGMCLISLSGMYIGAQLCAPDLTKFHERSYVLYDREGNLIFELMPSDNGDYHRILTTPRDVDPLYLKFLLAAEDERFYHHLGVDPFSIARAAYSNLVAGEVVSGASTLAMQVCRLLEPKARTLVSKAQEALGALYLTQEYGREQVLTMYLTLAPFGGNIEGVTAASYYYFGHSPQHLTPAEAALLVALPRAPEAIRPDRHLKAAHYYRNEVLKSAHQAGLIKADVLNSAMLEPIGTGPDLHRLPQSAFHLGQSLFTHNIVGLEVSEREHSGREVTECEVTSRELNTTIDPRVQQVLNEVVARYRAQLGADNIAHSESVAALAVDNETFEVLGYVGSLSPDISYYDAVQALRSPGSALKPFAYAMAFEQGLLHPNTVLLDSARFYNSYQPHNYDRTFHGEITAALALQGSLNLPALEVMQAIGADNFVGRLNYQHERLVLPPHAEPNLGIILGGVGIKLYDLTALYAALAHDGTIKPLTVVTNNPESTQGRSAELSSEFKLWDASAARATYEILQGSPAPNGMVNDLKISYKTGTSYKYRDAWALGSLGRLTLGIWTGRTDGTPSLPLSGIDKAAPLLFTALGQLDDYERTQPPTDLSGDPLLQPTPPLALSQVSVATLGRVKRTEQGTDSKSLLQPKLRLDFPTTGAQLALGRSQRLMVKIVGGRPPYYLLVDDKLQEHSDFFIPQRNGRHQIMVIDHDGNSVTSTVTIQGVRTN